MLDLVSFLVARCFVLIVIVFALASCSQTTGTHTVPDNPSLTGFQKLAITVTTEEGFSLRPVRDPRPNSAAVLLGFTGIVGGLAGAMAGVGAAAGIDALIGHGSDPQLAGPVEKVIKDYNPTIAFQVRLIQRLENERVYPSVIAISDGVSASGVDGTLKVTIKQWGLRYCEDRGQDAKVRAGILLESNITAIASAKVLWQREELYLDGDCYHLNEIQSREDLLITILSHAIDNASGTLVNEIRFP